MSEFPRKLIQEAINCLRLRDIVLYSSKFERGEIEAPERGAQQQKLNINHGLGRLDGGDGEPDILQVLVALGVQVVAGEDPSNSPLVFRIEANFLAEYSLTERPSTEAAQAFAEFNALHNVWPFWRQHVFDIVARAKLPELDIPLMGAVKP